MRGKTGCLSRFLLRAPGVQQVISHSVSPLEDRRKIALLRCAILASSILLMLPGAWSHSTTVLECIHLPAGLAAWQRQSLGIYCVCGPVSKLLFALPAKLAGVRVDYPASFDSDDQSRHEWVLGQIFQSQNRERYHSIYRWSRLLPILITVLGGVLICEWSTRLFGARPGVVSLCVWCWMPPILAHGSLVTSDVLSAVMLVLAARTFWTLLLRPRPMTAFLAGLTLGLAVATKFSLLILYPCWAILLIGRALQIRGVEIIKSRETRLSPAWAVALGLLMFVISVAVIDALYLFRDTGFRPAQWQSGLSSLARDLPSPGEGRIPAWLLRSLLPVPLEFLRGLDFQLADCERLQEAYLLGRTRLGGWWYWYLVASSIKIPLPVLALLVLALIRVRSAVRDQQVILWAGFCLFVPAAQAAIAIAATTGTGTNAAFRYLIPSIALLCVWAGHAWNAGSRSRSVVIGLLGWLALNAIVGLPDHLAWQNELGWAWRRWSGRPVLVGDSLDWGQDQARLGDWVARHSGEGMTAVCVYGFGDGEPFGLKHPAATPITNLGGNVVYMAVSVNALFGYGEGTFVRINDQVTSLSQDQRHALLRIQPSFTLGRTVYIYRIRDLPPDLFSRGV